MGTAQRPPLNDTELQHALDAWKARSPFTRQGVFELLSKVMEVASDKHGGAFADVFDLLVAASHGQLERATPSLARDVARFKWLAEQGGETRLDGARILWVSRPGTTLRDAIDELMAAGNR